MISYFVREGKLDKLDEMDAVDGDDSGCPSCTAGDMVAVRTACGVG